MERERDVLKSDKSKEKTKGEKMEWKNNTKAGGELRRREDGEREVCFEGQ